MKKVTAKQRVAARNKSRNATATKKAMSKIGSGLGKPQKLLETKMKLKKKKPPTKARPASKKAY